MRAPRRDRGSILVLALLVSASAAIAGMWMVLTSDLGVRRNRYLVRAFEASRVAQSGLQVARQRLGADSGWSGGSAADPLDPSATVAVSVARIGYQYVRASCVGAVADSTQTVTGDLRAVAHRVLGLQVVSGSILTLDDVTIGGYLRANGDVIGLGDVDFTGTLETVSGASVTAEVNEAQVVETAESLDPPALPLGDYLARSSPLLSVPVDPDGQQVVLERVSLLPGFNPFGASNADGAYSLDAGGREVVLRDVYIEGCLTIHNTAGVRTERGYHHRRSAAHLASLVVDGRLELRLEAPLQEVFAAYDFDKNGLITDVHEPLVEGLVHASGEVVGPYGGRVRGLLIGAEVILRGYATLEADDSLLTQPLVGYVQPGAWDIVVGSIGSGP